MCCIDQLTPQPIAAVRNLEKSQRISHSRSTERLEEMLQVYALWAEILGGVAILVSLLFVGVQLKQSNSLISVGIRQYF